MKEKLVASALAMIKDGMTIGLGGGSTVALLTEELSKSNLDIKIVTPSYTTAVLCKKFNLTVLDASLVDTIDLAFDGCDEVDTKFNALKSGGAIHTAEKIIGTMANDYILIVDQTKYFETLPFNHSITLEVVPLAQELVKKELSHFGANVSERISQTSDGCTRSTNGNLIFEAIFSEPPAVDSLNQKLLEIPGIVDTSLFFQIATQVLLATETEIKHIKRRA